MTATPLTHRNELKLVEQRLQTALGDAAQAGSPDWARQPSGLPGWTRGHVVAHLLGNVEGMLNLARWAETGVRTPMYASAEVRQSDIDDRAGWPMARLLDEMTARSAEFALACDSLVEPVANRGLELGSGAAIGVWELPMVRIREIEIHQVDLAAGYQPADWSAAFSVRTMGQVQPMMAARGNLPVANLCATDTGRVWNCAVGGPDLWGPETELLAWLIGRPHHGLACGVRPQGSDDPIPAAPTWV